MYVYLIPKRQYMSAHAFTPHVRAGTCGAYSVHAAQDCFEAIAAMADHV